MSRFGDDSPQHRVNSAKTLGTVQHMHKGTPYVYQGEELGMTNTYFTAIEQYRDIESLNYHAALSLGMEVEAVLHSLSVKSRDNAHVPRCSGTTPHTPEFTEGIPWLPVNPSYLTINAAAIPRTRTQYFTIPQVDRASS